MTNLQRFELAYMENPGGTKPLDTVEKFTARYHLAAWFDKWQPWLSDREPAESCAHYLRRSAVLWGKDCAPNAIRECIDNIDDPEEIRKLKKWYVALSA